MQKVSKAYRQSMKNSLRERAYIMISFGLVNQEAQAKAKIDSGEFAYFSNKDNIFSDRSDELTYATLEENFTRVDGTMMFLPRENQSGAYYDTGLIGEKLVSEAIYELTINLHTDPMDFKGLTIDFGENYPVNFDVIGSTGQTIEYRNNNLSVWTTEDVIVNTSFVKLRFYKMKNEHSRLRVYSIRFGYGLVYYNDSVMSSSLESYVSPIGADIPQVDFSVTLKNYDKYFNVDNPKSALNFLETGQEMDIYYGYQVGENVEWIRGNHLFCSEWESDDYTATIRCQDIFRSMDSEYYKGVYSSQGISYYDLAVKVLQDAGETDYYIDPRLKKLYTKNPLSRVKHKEALQIIANACRCVLTQTRLGAIQIKSNFTPESSISANGETNYSNVANVLSSTNKSEYASLNTNYTTADGTMFFLPRNGVGSLYTGFVSNAISNEDCEFVTNPIITVSQEAACMYHGVKLEFGNALPRKFIIRTFNNGSPVDEYLVEEEEISKTTTIIYNFDDFDVMKIEFVETAEPFNRIILNYFAFGDVTDFTMERNDMTSSPKAIKQELVKEVIVPCYSYQKGTQQETLTSEETTVVAGQITTYYVGEASHDFSVKVNNSTTGATILDSGSYFITVEFNVTGTFVVEILGYRYKVTERYAVNTLNARGKTIKWENPLISDMTMASDLATWLGDYYMSGIEYEYETRGFPEIDVNDIIYQENEFYEGMKVNVYRETLTFAQAFGGKVTARRVGGY